MNRRPFTPDEDAAIVAQYATGPLCALVPVLGRTERSIASRARLLVARGVIDASKRFYQPPWTEGDDDTLRDEWGNMPDAKLAKQLGRSVVALEIRAKRLGISRKENWLCARAVGRILGVDSKRVTDLAERGLLKARRSSVGAGEAHAWRIEVEALERFLRRHPGWYDPARVLDEPWRSLARQARARDPLLTVDEAARALGVHPQTVRRHLRRGWLTGERVHDSGNGGTWRVRRSALAAFTPRNPGSVGLVVLASVAGVNGQRGAHPEPRKRPSRRVQGSDHELRVRRSRLRPVQWRESA